MSVEFRDKKYVALLVFCKKNIHCFMQIAHGYIPEREGISHQ